MARCGEESCAGRFEEGLDDDCRYAVDCFAKLYESFSYRFGNTASRTSHPGCRHTGRNHRLAYNFHRGIGPDRRPIAFGLHHDGNRRHGADEPVTVVARYPYYSRIDARPAMSMCF